MLNQDIASVKSLESGVDSSAESMCTEDTPTSVCTPAEEAGHLDTHSASTALHKPHQQPHSPPSTPTTSHCKSFKVDKQWKKEVMLLYQMIYNHKLVSTSRMAIS